MLHTGQILDNKYEIISILGQGGMGTVYLCRNNRLGNLWAVKEIIIESNNRIDFLTEPNLLKNLNHPGIVRIVDIFYEADNIYIVEDYIEGKTLKEHVDSEGPMSSEMMIEIAEQLCSILDYLHSFNPPIIYRDLKPSNVMIKPDNRVVLIDFGIARTYKEGQEGDTIILGSKGYIAPEQLVNIQSNAQTDIYSLGATMFFMLTGKSISLPTELMFVENYPTDADKNLIRIIQKASAIEPENRYSNIRQMLSDFSSVLTNEKYEKTRLLNSFKTEKEAFIGKLQKPKGKTKFIILTLLVCIISVSIFIALIMSNNASRQKLSEQSAKSASQTDSKSEVKQDPQPPKEIVEKDTLVRGILDSKKPVILSSSSSGKGKGKDKNEEKNLHLQFVLNPAAAVSNSKLSIALTHIEAINKDAIAILSIQNTADAALKLDLSKTYLINGKNEAKKSYNPNSTSLIAIPQGSSKQELKLYFKDFGFEGSSYTLKTVLSSDVNKDINLYIDIK